MIIAHKKFAGTSHPDIDRQTRWLNEYKLDAVRVGRMCEKFPGLQNSWNQFKIMYDLCRSQDDIDRQVS
jgi:hypothetical protein